MQDPVLYDMTTLLAVGVVCLYLGFALGASLMAWMWHRERRHAGSLRLAA